MIAPFTVRRSKNQSLHDRMLFLTGLLLAQLSIWDDRATFTLLLLARGAPGEHHMRLLRLHEVEDDHIPGLGPIPPFDEADRPRSDHQESSQHHLSHLTSLHSQPHRLTSGLSPALESQNSAAKSDPPILITPTAMTTYARMMMIQEAM